MFTVKIKRKALKNLAKIHQEQKRHIKEVVFVVILLGCLAVLE
jgi:hypothetical protein